MFVLDSDICIWLLRGQAPAAAARLRDLPMDAVATTTITAGEIRYGALRSQRPKENLARVETLLAPLALLPFDNRAACHFADIKAHLTASGSIIGPMDLLIAAIARARNATLVTGNLREFSRVPGLAAENWLA